MSGTTNHWKLGLFVVSSMVVGVVVLIGLGYGVLQRDTRLFVAFFDESVDGLDIGSPVKYRGVTVGTVTGIGFGPDRVSLRVSAEVYEDALAKLGLGTDPDERPTGIAAQLVSAGLTGGRFIEVDIFSDGRERLDFTFPLPDNAFPTVRSDIDSATDELLDAITTLPVLLASIKDVADELRDISKSVNEEIMHGALDDFHELIAQTTDKLAQVDAAAISDRVLFLIDQANATLGHIDHGVDDIVALRDPARDLLARLDRLADDIDADLDQILAQARVGETTDELRQAARAVTDLSADARPAVLGSALLAEDIELALADLRATLGAVRSLVELVERDPGILLRGRDRPPGERP